MTGVQTCALPICSLLISGSNNSDATGFEITGKRKKTIVRCKYYGFFGNDLLITDISTPKLALVAASDS